MEENRMNPIGCLISIIIALLTCAMLGGCKSAQSTVRERVVYDTVWSVKVVHDSINGMRAEKEITKIVPHIIKVGDTTIVYSDTIINRSSDNNTYLTKYIYQDQGKVSKDSARLEEKKSAPVKDSIMKKQKDSKWRLFWTGAIVGVLVILVYDNRERLLGLIRRLVKRKKI